MEQLTEIRVRTKIPESEMEQKVGKILAESDYNVKHMTCYIPLRCQEIEA